MTVCSIKQLIGNFFLPASSLVMMLWYMLNVTEFKGQQAFRLLLFWLGLFQADLWHMRKGRKAIN